MKSLLNYINEQNALMLMCNERLMHAEDIIHKDFNILRGFKDKYQYQILEASNALYKGQFELAEFLGLEIIKKHSYNCQVQFYSKDLTKFDNIFFDKVIIEYKPFKHEGGYKGNKNEIDNDLKLYVIKIFVNSENNKKFETIFSTIAHELKHAWQDYKTDFGKNSPSIISNSDNYKTIVNNLSNKPIDIELAANYLYHSFKIEKDAFASEFATELKIEIEKDQPKDINDCIKLAHKINIFNELYLYKEIFVALDVDKKYEIRNKENNIIKTIYQKDIVNEINNITHKNYTWKQICNKYIRKLEKSFHKLCNIIANMYFEYSEKDKEITLEELITFNIVKHKF